VSWQFKHVGQILVPSEGVDEEALTLAALEAGAEDVADEDGSFVVYTPIEELHRCNEALEKAGFTSSDAELTFLATNKTELGEEDAQKLVRLLDALDELDDVQDTYVNVDLTEEMLQEA